MDIPNVGDRVKLTDTKSDRNTGVVVAIRGKRGTTKARFMVKPDHPTPQDPDWSDPGPDFLRSPDPDFTNPDDLWDCAAGELEVIGHDESIGTEVLHLAQGTQHMYNGNPDDLWWVTAHEPDAKYAYCSKGGLDRNGRPTGKAKNIPAALLTPVVDTKKAKRVKGAAPAVRREKKRKDNIGDSISNILAEAENLEQLWAIAAAAGLDVPTVKARIGHLNPGLQRMGIGNRLRTLQKRGELKEVNLTWTSKGLQPKDE